MVGLIDDVDTVAPTGFQADGDIVVLIGPRQSTLDCSEYLAGRTRNAGPAPTIDLALEARSHEVCRRLARSRLARSAQDCSDGGLAIALAECAIDGGRGFRGSAESLEELQSANDGRLDAVLFGEAQSRFVISCRVADLAEIERECAAHGVPCTTLGAVGGDTLEWGPALAVPVNAVRTRWAEGLSDVIA